VHKPLAFRDDRNLLSGLHQQQGIELYLLKVGKYLFRAFATPESQKFVRMMKEIKT
jgi:hypothetical protein